MFGRQPSTSPSRPYPSPRGTPLYQPSPSRSSGPSSSLSPYSHQPHSAGRPVSTHSHASTSAGGMPMPQQPHFVPGPRADSAVHPARTSSRQAMPPLSPSSARFQSTGAGGSGGFSLKPTYARNRSDGTSGTLGQSSMGQHSLAPPAQPQGQQRQSINTRLAAVTQQYIEPSYQQYPQAPVPEPAQHAYPGHEQASSQAGSQGYGQDVFGSYGGDTGEESGYTPDNAYHSYDASHGYDHALHMGRQDTFGPAHPHGYTHDYQHQHSYPQGARNGEPDPQAVAQSYYAQQYAAPPVMGSTARGGQGAERQYTFNRASTSAPPSGTAPSAPVSIAADAPLPLSAVGQPRGYAYQPDRRTDPPAQTAEEAQVTQIGAPERGPSPAGETSAASVLPVNKTTTAGVSNSTSPTSVKRSQSRRSIFASGHDNNDAAAAESKNDSPTRLRKSRSSDLLRRLSRRENETVSGGEYVPLQRPANEELATGASPVHTVRQEERRGALYARNPDPDMEPEPQAVYGAGDRGTTDQEALLPPRLPQFHSQASGLSHSDSMPLLSNLPSTFPMPPTRQQVNPSPGQYDDPASSEFPAVAAVPEGQVPPEEEELQESLPASHGYVGDGYGKDLAGDVHHSRSSWAPQHAATVNDPNYPQASASVHAPPISDPTPGPANPIERPMSSDSSTSRPFEPKRISDPVTGLHSRNAALFEAERGGKALHFYEEDGTWSANSLVPTPLNNNSVKGQRRRSTGEALVLEQAQRERLGVDSNDTQPYQQGRRPSLARPLSAGAPVGEYHSAMRDAHGEQYAVAHPQGYMQTHRSRQEIHGDQAIDTRARPWSATTDPQQDHDPRYSNSHAGSQPSNHSYNSQQHLDPDSVNLEAPYRSTGDRSLLGHSQAQGQGLFNSSHPRRHVRSLSEGATLLRHGTLLHPASDPERAGKELGIMLGNRRRRLSAGKILPAPVVAGWDGGVAGVQQEKVRLEVAKKGRARVEVDVVLERECVVEGGEIRGRIEVKVGKKGVRVGMGKVRVVGYEDVSPQNRHIFYQHAHTLPAFEHPPSPSGPRTSLFASGPDADGFRAAAEGMHFIPFSMRLPLRGGAKGSFTSPNSSKGPAVRYVVVGSIKVHDQSATHAHVGPGKRSIAHFYRPIVVLPYLNPGVVLAPSEETVEVVERRGLGWSLGGNKGSVELRIALGRSIWVSGQRVWCEVGVRNDSSKRVKSLTLALLQTVTTFLPDDVIRKNRLSVDKDGIPNADEALGIASTTRRKVAEETIEADDTDWGSGQVTGKQWWTGVAPGEMGGWDLSLLLPNGMITIPRSRLVEVSYTLRLTANSSIYVDVPVVLINFLSIDPPPMPGDGARLGNSMAVSVDGLDGQMRNMGIASTSGHGHSVGNDGVYAYGTGHGHKDGSQHSGDSFRGIARASSTTLHIDALLSAGRARAEEHGRSGEQDARTRQHRPGSVYSDYTPEPASSRSHLGTGNGTLSTSRSMPGMQRNGEGSREAYHNRSIDRRRAPLDPAAMGGATPARPKVPRVMSYLSVHSSELDQSLSDEEPEDEDDEIGKTLREAARREGRKMSLAALTRAAAREKAEVMGHRDPSQRAEDGSGEEQDTSEVLATTPNLGGATDGSADLTDSTPRLKTLQILDQTPTATPAMLNAPLPPLPPSGSEHAHDTQSAEPVPTTAPQAAEADVRSQIEMHTPVSDGLEQIDEVNEEASNNGDGDEDSFRVISTYGGPRTDDESGSRPGSSQLRESHGSVPAPPTGSAYQGYSEELLQPIATLPELSLDDVLSQRKWSVDMRFENAQPQPQVQATVAEESDDDDKPLAMIARASPAATPKKQAAARLPDWRDGDRTPTQPSTTPMSPPFAYDSNSPASTLARLPHSHSPRLANQHVAPSTSPPATVNSRLMYSQEGLFSSTSLGGTGLTTSTNRAPSRKGSALDPQQLLCVADEHQPPVMQRGGSRFGSFAASTSAMSDQESEVGQVVQAVKRNLSVKVPVSTVHMDSRYADEAEEADPEEEKEARQPVSPSPRREGRGVRGGRAMPAERGSPIKWAQNTLSAHAPPLSGPRSMGPSQASRSNSYFLDARRRSSGISPRSNYQPVVGSSSLGASAGEPMMRGPSANGPSALRNQIALQPPVSLASPSYSPEKEQTEEESTLPPLAASVEGDSSSDGHDLDSPHMLETPGVGLEPRQSSDKRHDTEHESQMAHQQLLQSMRNIASPTPKTRSGPASPAERRDSTGPKLDPDWVPGDHLLHTEVAFARTSFSIPAGPSSDDTHSHGHTIASHHSHSSSYPSLPSSRQNSDNLSPLRRPSVGAHTYGTKRSQRSAHGHANEAGHRATSPTPTTASVRSMKSAHSSHSVVLSGMQYKLQHMQARDEALRKFSVASAASSGRRESILGGVEQDGASQAYGVQQMYGGYPYPAIPSVPSQYAQLSGARQRQVSGGEGGRSIKPRKSYTAALGPRP